MTVAIKFYIPQLLVLVLYLTFRGGQGQVFLIEWSSKSGPCTTYTHDGGAKDGETHSASKPSHDHRLHIDANTDHEEVKALFNTPHPSGKLARWGMAIHSRTQAHSHTRTHIRKHNARTNVHTKGLKHKHARRHTHSL